jgi:PAS domain S-box-containing protein
MSSANSLLAGNWPASPDYPYGAHIGETLPGVAMGDGDIIGPGRSPTPDHGKRFDLAAQLVGLAPITVEARQGNPAAAGYGQAEGDRPGTAATNGAGEMAREHAVAALLDGHQETPGLLDGLLASAIAASGAYAGALTVGPLGGALQVVTIRGYAPEVVTGIERLDLDLPVPLTEAVRLRTPVWFPTWDQDPEPPSMEARRTRALCALPLVTGGGQLLGVLGLSFESADALSEGRRARLTALAHQSCLVLERMAAERLGRTALASADQARALLETVLDEAPVGLAFFDTEGRYLRVNQALERMNGVPAADHVGRTVPEVLASLASRVPDDLLRVIATGEPVVNREVSGSTPASPGEHRHWLASYYPVRGADGALIAVGVVVVEITDSKRAEVERARLLDAARVAAGRLALLADAGEILGASLNLAETIDRLLELLVNTLGELCALLVPGPDGLLRLAAARHADPARRAALDHLRDNVVRPGAHSARVFAQGTTILLDEVSDEDLRAACDSEEHYRAALQLAPGPSMLIPMMTRGQVTGVLTLAAPRGAPAYGHEDVALVEELARRAATAMENAKLFGERAAIADALQASLLPPHLPVVPGLSLAAHYHPAGRGLEVGGDFYDIFRVAADAARGGDDEAAWAVMVGDVVGNGARAAAVTAVVRHTARAVAPYLRDPGEIVAAVNRALLQLGDDEQFCTLAYGHVRLEPGGAAVDLVSGGHPPPLLVRATGAVEEVSAAGTLLGQFDEHDCQQVTVDLGAGDVLVLFTDGVIEARAPRSAGEPIRLLGEEGLVEALSGAHGQGATAIASAVASAVLDFTGGDAADDFAVLALEVTPVG